MELGVRVVRLKLASSPADACPSEKEDAKVELLQAAPGLGAEAAR